MELPGPFTVGLTDLAAALADGFALVGLIQAQGPTDARDSEPMQARVNAVLAALRRAELLFAELGHDPAASGPEPLSPTWHARTKPGPGRCRPARLAAH